jgi:hypothetical protein
MNRDNHYEAAFEAFLRDRGIGFIAVDEARRTLLGDADVKSLDFIIVGPHDARLVVDVKGRRFPGGTSERPIKSWQNWSTVEDIDGLDTWAGTLGAGFRGVLAFVYHILPPFVLAEDTPDTFTFRESTYLMRGVEISAYRRAMRRRSPRWGTVHLPSEAFRRMVRPFSELLSPELVITAEGAESAELESVRSSSVPSAPSAVNFCNVPF